MKVNTKALGAVSLKIRETVKIPQPLYHMNMYLHSKSPSVVLTP